MRVKYAIEKEIEVIDGVSDEELNRFISALCDDEDGNDYIYSTDIKKSLFEFE